MHPFDHVIALILFVAGPVLSRTVGFRRLRRATSEDLPRVRTSVYRVAITVQWTFTLIVLAWWAITHRSPRSLGFAPPLTPGMIGALVGVVIIAIALIRQRSLALRDDDALAEVRDRLAHLELMLPHSAREFRWFAALSVTAGICEETLYRGFLTWYLLHAMGLVPAFAVASIVFGLGHAYQGPRGILLTTVVGGFLAAVYWVSGSLFVPMLIHALMDLHSGHLAWRAYERRTQQRLGSEEPPNSGSSEPASASIEARVPLGGEEVLGFETDAHTDG